MKIPKGISKWPCRWLKKIKEWYKKYKTFHELIAENLLHIFLYTLLAVFFVIFSSIISFSRLNSGTEVNVIVQYTFWILTSFYIGYNVFSYTYLSKFIISKLENFSARAQYNVLMLGKATRKITILLLFMSSVVVAILIIAMHIAGSSTIWDNLLFAKLFNAFILIFFGLAIFSLSILNYPPLIQEMEISFRIVKDFEAIVADQKTALGPNQSVIVWKNLMKMIVYGIRRKTKQFMGASIKKLIEPFNITTLALVTGNNEQQGKAKKWVEDLGKIMLNNNIDDRTKAKQILNYMKRAELDFPTYVDFCKKYEIDYGLEEIGVMPQLERILRICGPLATILAFIIALTR